MHLRHLKRSAVGPECVWIVMDETGHLLLVECNTVPGWGVILWFPKLRVHVWDGHAYAD